MFGLPVGINDITVEKRAELNNLITGFNIAYKAADTELWYYRMAGIFQDIRYSDLWDYATYHQRKGLEEKLASKWRRYLATEAGTPYEPVTQTYNTYGVTGTWEEAEEVATLPTIDLSEYTAPQVISTVPGKPQAEDTFKVGNWDTGIPENYVVYGGVAVLSLLTIAAVGGKRRR